MKISTRGRFAVIAAAVVASGPLTSIPVAVADPEPPPPPASSAAVPPADAGPQFGPGPHNVVYRARVDGVSRGALITYKMSDTDFNTADPTMIPGRTFEATGIVSTPQQAGMQVSIQWPYSASLHCQILVDDQVVAEADQFVAPRFTPQHNDPGYGVLSCGSVGNFPTGNTAPVDATPPPVQAPPAPEAAAPQT